LSPHLAGVLGTGFWISDKELGRFKGNKEIKAAVDKMDVVSNN
jgi:hypothetical protein